MEQPSSEEKALAALAHASGVLFFLGPIGAVIIWAIQREKSKYVRYHALQALGFQAYSFWTWMIASFLITFAFIAVSLVFIILTSESSATPPLVILAIEAVFFLIVFGILGLALLLQFAAAIFCLLGREFRYPLIGSWLQMRFLDTENEDEAKKWEEYWVGGVCHATAILQFWGMVTPLIVFFSQKDRSPSLKLQSLQAFFYQLIATLLYVISSALSFFLYIVFIVILATSGVAGDPGQSVSPESGFLFILIMVVFSLFWGASLILYPAYLILAGLASIRTLSGHDFKYPLLGRVIYNRISLPKVDETFK